MFIFQLYVFAENRHSSMNYTTSNQIAFSRLFLKGWDGSREVNNYPPSEGPLAVYQKDEFIDNINFTVRKVRR